MSASDYIALVFFMYVLYLFYKYIVEYECIRKKKIKTIWVICKGCRKYYTHCYKKYTQSTCPHCKIINC